MGNSFFSPYIPSYPTFTNASYSIPGQVTPITVIFPSGSYWEDFFNAINITKQTYDYNPELYQSIFMNSYTQFSAKQTEAALVISPTATPNLSEASWQTFLTTSDTAIRVRAPFMWVFNILLKILSEQQRFTIAEGNRTTTLVGAQSSAISSIGRISLLNNGSENPTVRFNQNQQLYVQIYNTWNSVIGGQESIASGNIQTGNQAIQQQNTLMTGLIQQVQTIVSQLFTS